MENVAGFDQTLRSEGIDMSKHAHNPTYKATEASKTAQYANPRHKGPTKHERRHAARVRDWDGLPTEKKQGTRWPGSLQ